MKTNRNDRMTAKTLAGYEYSTNSHTYRFIEPFIEMVNSIKQYKHFNSDILQKKYSLSNGELFDLIGKAEEFCNQTKEPKMIVVTEKQ